MRLFFAAALLALPAAKNKAKGGCRAQYRYRATDQHGSHMTVSPNVSAECRTRSVGTICDRRCVGRRELTAAIEVVLCDYRSAQHFARSNLIMNSSLYHDSPDHGQDRHRCLRGGLGGTALALTLIWTTAAFAQSAPGQIVPRPAIALPAAEPILTLNEAVDVSLGDQPSAAAFEREADASEQAAIAARTLPDPQLTLGTQNLPVTGRMAFDPSADFMTMHTIGIMREQVRRSKREAEAARLRAEAVVSRTEATVQERRIARDVMVAWINAVEAQAKQRLLDRIMEDLSVAYRVMVAGVPTKGSTPADALQMQAEISLARAQLADAQGQEQRARAELSRGMGSAAQRPLPNSIPAVALPANAQKAVDLSIHPQIRLADAQEQAALRQVDVARRERKPNLTWSAMYGWRPDLGDMVTVGVTIPLQINRSRLQDRRIAEASARADAARLRAEDAR